MHDSHFLRNNANALLDSSKPSQLRAGAERLQSNQMFFKFGVTPESEVSRGNGRQGAEPRLFSQVNGLTVRGAPGL